MKWSVGTKISGGYILGLIMLVFIGITSYYNTTRLIETSDLTVHTYLVLTKLERLLSLLKDVETSQRGYIITGKESYLEPYQNAVKEIDKEISEVKILTTDNISQQQRLNTLESLANNKIAELQETVNLRRERGLEAAITAVTTDKGKKAMDDIRSVLSLMENEENTLLKQRSVLANTGAQNTLSIIIYGVTFSVLLLSVVSFFITRNITIPLREVSEAATKISAGDLSITLSVDQRKDEVGVMKLAFSKMTQSFLDMAHVAEHIANGNLVVDIKAQSDKDILGTALSTMITNIKHIMSDIKEGVNVLSSSVNEILAVVSQVSSGAAETATAVVQMTSTVEEVKQTALVSAQKAKNVSDTAQKAAQVSITGKKAVEQSIEGMYRIQSQVEFIAISIVKLSEQTQDIGEIIATVNDLAEQSNLLAVNAAIEAAKAGEQGRGFAVVAQEVKSLAEQSKQATTQVRSILGDVQKAMNKAVMATERGTKVVEQGVKLSVDTGEAISQLSESITESSQAATQIAASSQQQLVGMDQIVLAMDNIRQATSQNMVGIKQAEETAHNLNNLGQFLRLVIENN